MFLDFNSMMKNVSILNLPRFIFLIWVISSFITSIAQNVAVGSWRDHLPYNNIISITKAGNKIIGATSFSLMIYDEEDQSLSRFNKIHGLSDIGITSVRYHDETGTLLIGYSNGNMDAMIDGEIINFADILRSNIIGSKGINHIQIEGDLAYLACGFGITVFDIPKQEFKETYFIGSLGTAVPVYQTTIFKNRIYALVNNHLTYASLNSNLTDYQNWLITGELPDGEYTSLAAFDNQLYTVLHKDTLPDTLFRYDGADWTSLYWKTDLHFVGGENDDLIIAEDFQVNVYDHSLNQKINVWTYGEGTSGPVGNEAFLDEDVLWIADANYGIGNSNFSNLLINGPNNNFAFALDYENQNIWVATGTRDISALGAGQTRTAGVHQFEDENWKSYGIDVPGLDSLYDLVDIQVDPSNTDKVYVASQGVGLGVLEDGEVTEVYDNTNSSIESFSGYKRISVVNVEMDEDGNLWATNQDVVSGLHCRVPSGEWYAMPSAYIRDQVHIHNLLISSVGHKWVSLSNGNMAIYDDNGTPSNSNDDRELLLTTGSGNGNLTGGQIFALAEDKNGDVWVGSSDGILVFYSVFDILDKSNYDGSQILVQKDGFTQYLFENQQITSILVDGANRKWVGTDGAGLFLLSADGTQELQHFTTENSPLLDNTIYDLEIHPYSGELFIATGKGLISYRGTATEGFPEMKEVFVFPNPVKENYDGPIAIRGMLAGSVLKITDVDGNLVYESESFGGQAIWYGKDLEGNRVASGIYLAIAVHPETGNKAIGKIMFMN